MSVNEKHPRRLLRERARTLLREDLAWSLNAEGFSTRKIAERMVAEGMGPVSHVAVHKMLKRAEARALAEMSEKIQGRKAVQAARLECIFQESMDGFRRSQEDAQVARQKTVKGEPPAVDAEGDPVPGTGHPERREEALEIRPQAGDPGWLRVALQAQADERRLYGLDAPERREISGPEGSPIRVEPSSLADEMKSLEGLSADELESYLAIRGKIAANANRKALDAPAHDQPE